ncbi:hypothetical protein PIB30_046908 [Stylosanthes scabra]|uniref:Uncharacterized protein n=1 Tax=Stylosanthes scabra TaxID=79078 RepID=A0ABU6VHJ9_9FABA|nr:hypothetical protein [Stylosanthes scabra]
MRGDVRRVECSRMIHAKEFDFVDRRYKGESTGEGVYVVQEDWERAHYLRDEDRTLTYKPSWHDIALRNVRRTVEPDNEGWQIQGRGKIRNGAPKIGSDLLSFEKQELVTDSSEPAMRATTNLDKKVDVALAASELTPATPIRALRD